TIHDSRAPAGMPRGEPSFLDRPRRGPSVRRSAVFRRAAARAPASGNAAPAAEQYDELAASHSITSSAMESSLSGTVRPSILAVSALMTSSNLVDCMTGRSAGLAPLRMRPV